MKAKEGVIERLNAVFMQELTAINQHFTHAMMCQNWGYDQLHEKIRNRSIDEMKDAEAVFKHILFLEGVPNLQRLGSISVGESVPEQFQLDLQLEQDAVRLLSDAIAHCIRVEDYTTHGLLEGLADRAESHLGWIETQRRALEQVGLPNYLSQQLRG